MKKLNTDIVRSHFPALDSDWVFFDNAGGTQVASQVGNRISDYLFKTNVQLGASYEVSQESEKKVVDAQNRWAQAINAKHTQEVVFGSSTTALLQNLSRSLVQTLNAGDEVIVTNSDHEANVGPWMEMKKNGIEVKIWKVNPDSFKLELNDLESLMTDKTKLVAFTHVSNILGTINPVKEMTRFIHEKGAMVCVDGVAYAPHRLVDVQDWGVDFYVFSFYKVYGPHYSLLFGKKEILETLPSLNHFFIGMDDTPYKLQPGNVNYELTVGCDGVLDYLDDIYSAHFEENTIPPHTRYKKVFDIISDHEEVLSKQLIDFLNTKESVKIIGENSANKDIRVPTIAFIVKNKKSSTIPPMVDPHKIGIRWGDFYARRLIDDLGLSSNDGIIRVSMVHYNTVEEIDKLIAVLDKII